MAINSVRDVGSQGITRDLKPALVPSRFWTDGRNIRFRNMRVEGMGGCVSVLPSTVTGLLNVGLIASPLTKFFIYSTGAKLFSFDGLTTHDITRAVGGDYSDDADTQFDFLSFNGFGIFNQVNDLPQLWDASAGSNDCVDLTNWNTLWRTKKMRNFKGFLFAMGMEESGTQFPHKLRWSTPAEAGAVPSSWDDADPTNLAGSFDFPDTKRGELVDGLELGDNFYIYKEGSIWEFQFVGGDEVFTRELIVNDVGLRVPRSLVELPTMQGKRVHFFAGDDNFYVMDGLTVTPVFEDVFRREIVALRGENYQKRAFSVVNYRESELWFCIPQAGDDYCTLAFVMNYQNMTYTVRELSGAGNITAGIGFDSSSISEEDDIDFDDDTFFSDGTGFATTTIIPNQSAIVEASPVREQIYYLDRGPLDYDGVSAYPRYVTRESLATTKVDPRNVEAEVVDYNARKVIDHIVPKLYGGSVELTIGVQEQENVAISYLAPEVIRKDEFRHHFPQPVSARFHTFMFKNVGTEDFILGGFDYNVNVLGEF